MPPIYVSFKNKLIELKIKQKKEIVATIFNVGFYSVDTKNEIIYTCKQNTKILSARSVLEELTGETVPCFLIHQVNQLYLFALSSDLTKFIPLRKVDELNAVQTETDILILDGPALLFMTKKSVSIHFSDDIAMCILKKQCYDLPTAEEKICSCSKNEVKSGIKQNKCSIAVLHVSFIHQKYLLFLERVTICNCSQAEPGLFVLEWSPVNGFIPLNSKEFIPEEYRSTLTCLYHYEQKKLHECTFKTVQTVIIGTSDGFIIEIESGHLLKCVSLCSESLLPSPQPINRICFSENKLCGNKDTVLVIQDDKTVGLNRQFGIIRSWTGITKIFQCGYTDAGLLQFLLVRGETLQDGWILTDLDSQEISCEHPTPGQDEAKSESSESLGSAVEALQKRLQGERLLLYEKEQQLRKCERFTREVSSRQLQLLEGRGTAHRTDKPDLLPLIEGPCLNSETAGKQQISSEEEPGVEIAEIWQRTYNDKWLVAVSFRNKCSSDILVSVSLAPSNHHGNQDHLTCHSTQVLSKGRHNQSRTAVPHRNQAKYPRIEVSSSRFSSKDLDHAKGYSEPDITVCKTDLPNFGVSNSYSAAVFARWTRNDVSKSENDNSAPRERTEIHTSNSASGDIIVGRKSQTNSGHVFSRHCGDIVLKAEDVISGKYEINVFTHSDPYDVEMQDLKDMKRDAAALAMIQETALLEIRSTPSILTSLDQLLIDRCHFTYNQRLSCYVTRIPPLSRVQLQLGPYTGGDKRTVKVYSSCDKELFLLVHHLYASLPDHVIILHQSISSSDIIQRCLPSLQRELNFLEHGVRKLLGDTEHRESESIEANEGKQEDIRKIGEKFKRQKEKLMEKMKREVNKDKLSDLYEQLMRIARETDSNIVRAVSKQ